MEQQREIKFRGKKIDQDEWMYGYYFVENHLGFLRYVIMHYERLEGEDVFYEVIPESVGQYTGLKDKNGIEIYEGDILKTPGKYSHRVEFLNGSFVRHINEYDLRNTVNILYPANEQSEVIGNKFENPELL